MIKELYSIALGNLPILPWRAKKAIKMIKELKGLVGITPYYPHGTLLYFENVNDAKEARNVLRFKGIVVGTEICKFVKGENGEYVLDSNI